MNLANRIAYLGPDYSFSHIVVLEHINHVRKTHDYNPELLPQSNIFKVFEAVASQKGIVGYVPIQNSSTAAVVETLEALVRWHQTEKINIVDSAMLDIQLAMGGLVDAEKIDKVLSKDKAIQQCRGWLHDNYLDVDIIDSIDSTSLAAQYVKNKKYENAAAVAHPQCLEGLGLQIYATGIRDNSYNTTQFLIIEKEGKSQPSKKTQTDRTTIAVIQRSPIPDYFTELPALFRRYNVECLAYNARPSGTGMQIHFYDLKGHRTQNKNIGQLIRALEERQPFKGRVEICSLGSYHCEGFYPRQIKKIGIIGAGRTKTDILKGVFENAGLRVLSPYDKKQKPERESGLTDRKLRLYESVVSQSDAVVVHTMGLESTDEQRLFRMLASYASFNQLIVLHSTYLDGMEERVRKITREELDTQLRPIVKEILHSQAKETTKKRSALFRYTSRRIDQFDGNGEKKRIALVDHIMGNLQVIGMKYLASPDAISHANHNVIFTYDNRPEIGTRAHEYLRIFESAGMSITETSASAHDFMFSSGKIYSHLAATLLFQLLPEDIDPVELMKFGAPDVQRMIAAAVNVLASEPGNLTGVLAQYPNKQSLVDTLHALGVNLVDKYSKPGVKPSQHLRGISTEAVTLASRFRQYSGRTRAFFNQDREEAIRKTLDEVTRALDGIRAKAI